MAALTASSHSSCDVEGNWFPAPIVPGTVLVNVGLAMEGELSATLFPTPRFLTNIFPTGWTGGLFRATLHRVITHSAPDGSFTGRKSIAYFVQVSAEV